MSKKLNILIHTQYYPPELGAPQARLSSLAESLCKRGHHVTILTGMPNYPQGKIFQGYKGFLKVEQANGIRIVRTAILPSQSTRLLPRLTNYFSFVISSLFIGGWFIGKPDFILTESPPIFLGISGYLLSRWKRAKWIFNVSDLWPESAVRLGVISQGSALKLSYALEAFCYKKAWLVTGQSKSIIQNIQERYPEVKTQLFSNGVDVETFAPQMPSPVIKEDIACDGHIVALYAGLFGIAQGLDQILLAAHQVREVQELKIVLMGDGPERERLIQQANEMKLHNVHFLDPQPKERMPEFLAAADFCIIPHKTHIPGAVPSKLYEAMAAGKPILLVAEGEAADIVSSNHAGIVVHPGDIKGIASELVKLSQDQDYRKRLGDTGRSTAVHFYNRREINADLINYLEASSSQYLSDKRQGSLNKGTITLDGIE